MFTDKRRAKPDNQYYECFLHTLIILIPTVLLQPYSWFTIDLANKSIHTMRLQNNHGSVDHLTYCSNIHPGESWEEVLNNVNNHIPLVRQAMQTDEEFGIGLRLSAEAVKDLASPAATEQFKSLLTNHNSYVFTINAFPYGPFHGTRVKEDVYLPDWKDPERLRYTNEIADVFARLLPEGQNGSISTVPGAFKACVTSDADITLMARQMVANCAHLARLDRDQNTCIVLALEPEPCCFLETIEESVNFFRDYLYSTTSVKQLQDELDITASAAEQLLHRHLTLCLDLCHAAVEFEDANTCLATLREANIKVGKLQISAGLRLDNVTPKSAEILRPFFDEVYLHQVVENHDGTINRYTDLPEAFQHLTDDNKPREWRVHFHVPVFLDDLGDFSSTQFFIRDALALHKLQPVSEHLEVETYTWNVLPDVYKNQSIDEAIARELNWVRQQLS